jgi:hypothetical protein
MYIEMQVSACSHTDTLYQIPPLPPPHLHLGHFIFYLPGGMGELDVVVYVYTVL